MSAALDADAVFAALVAAHAGLDEAQSRRLDAMLVLLLAQEVGAMPPIMAAIAEARRLV